MTTYNTGNPVPSGNPFDRFDNSQTFDEVVNSSADEASTRLGAKVKTLKWLEEAALAIPAIAAAVEAETQANRAESEADRASLYAESALSADGIKKTTAEGLASGDTYFWLVSPDSDRVLMLYENVAGAAVDTGKRTVSSAGLNQVSDRVTAIEPIVKSLGVRKGVNLYNNANQVPGGSFHTTTGADTTPGGAWYRSEYIPVTAGQAYSLSLAPVPVLANMSHAFYNASKVFISGGGSDNNPTAPVGSAFLRVSFNWGGAVTAMVVKGALPGVYIPFRFEMAGDDPGGPLYLLPSLLDAPLKASGSAIVSALSAKTDYVTEKNASFIVTPSNLLDYESRILNTNINASTGLPVTVAGWWATDYIAVIDDGATYRGTTKSATINTVPQPQFSVQRFTGAWFNADKRWIAAISNLNVMIAPSGAAFVRLSSNSASPEKVMFTKGAGTPVRYEPYRSAVSLQMVKQILPPFWGGKWCAIGDSFTFLNQYADKLCSITGLQQVVNRGVSGQLLRTIADTLTVEDLAEIDVVTGLAGTNDYGHGNHGLGTISDSKETLSIYGDMRYVIDKILTLKPSVKLFIFTPTNRGAFGGEPVPPALNSYGLSIQSIGKAMAEVCRELGVPCYDLGANSFINQYTLTQYTSDNLHPNQAGADLIGAQMGRFINSRGPAVL